MTPPPRPGPLQRLAGWLQEAPPPPPLQLRLELGASRLVQWLDLLTRVSGAGVTPMHAVARATALAIARTPGANAVFLRGQCRSLPGVDLCLEVPGPDPADEQRRCTWRWLRPRAELASVPALSQEMQAGMAAVVPGQPLPPCSALITGQEAGGIELCQIPLPRGAACPLLLVLNPIEHVPCALHGAVVTRLLLRVHASFDPRVYDLHRATALLRELKLALEEPRRLETVDQFTGNLTPADTSTEMELPEPTGGQEGEPPERAGGGEDAPRAEG